MLESPLLHFRLYAPSLTSVPQCEITYALTPRRSDSLDLLCVDYELQRLTVVLRHQRSTPCRLTPAFLPS
ncbi:hypothetical protein M413DRAFT_447000 [Hebeloma cylindrosporum]|uniref:Uncharacterized protein n=1 Tax=Hebeloma cylindrosporum TaxID=76867 RepID=A0A0C3C5G5_HEBCY|nr:hypothetical protein M413DRAFT_447000 [Hebeloma cylindrosporum h7]